jgi:hypothetical protein
MTTDYFARDYASLVGKTVKTVRALTQDELEMFFWGNYEGMIIIFTDGTAIVPSADPEGNGPGHLFIERTTTLPLLASS